jgi:hypothetical protein
MPEVPAEDGAGYPAVHEENSKEGEKWLKYF